MSCRNVIFWLCNWSVIVAIINQASSHGYSYSHLVIYLVSSHKFTDVVLTVMNHVISKIYKFGLVLVVINQVSSHSYQFSFIMVINSV